jgi:hypothetical protein
LIPDVGSNENDGVVAYGHAHPVVVLADYPHARQISRSLQRIPVSWTNTNNSEQNKPENDIVVKSKMRWDQINNFKETFDNLRKFKIMFNPKKCVIKVSSGKLLVYLVSSRGIDAKLKKGEIIEKLQPPRIRKEIQKLTGMMVALSQFIF